MKRIQRAPGSQHPLHGVVLQAFGKTNVHDVTTLSVYLAGCTCLTDQNGNDCMDAYRTVAEDVLGYMESQGWLRKDAQGWYRIVNSN